MNEQCIWDTVQKAREYATFDTANGGKSFDMDVFHKKFAELIVQDCIANVKAWEKDSRNHISYMLKQHYGIKE